MFYAIDEIPGGTTRIWGGTTLPEAIYSCHDRVMTEDVLTIRRRVVESARWAVANKARFEYAEVRPIPLNGITLGHGLTAQRLSPE